MISDAINESDRLSSCNKRVRKKLANDGGAFQVYRFDVAGNQDGGDAEVPGEELRLNYNVGGICLSEAAFSKLQQEISLTLGATEFHGARFNSPWADREGEFFIGTVPVANGVFRKLVLRKSRVAQVDVRDLSVVRWTDRYYYEVFANPEVYAALPGEKSNSAKKS
jgi:hypothetical protein